MKKTFKIALIALLLLAFGALAFLYIGSHNIAVMNPKGMIGEKERDLIVTSSLLMLIVVIPVFVLTWIFAWRYRETNHKGKHTPDWEHNSLAEYCWWGVPFVIVVILSVLTWKSSHVLNPFKPIDSDVPAIHIQAVALEWKWLFIYPDQGIATVNYVQFPEKTPVNFEITADAPMNSFWIPQLGGQIYAMPAMRSKLHLIANEPGVFRGASSNFSGKGFAGMHFQAHSTSRQDFDAWVAKVKRSPQRLGLQEYDQLVEPSEYNPPSFYILNNKNLFDSIIEKYTEPQEKK